MPEEEKTTDKTVAQEGQTSLLQAAEGQPSDAQRIAELQAQVIQALRLVYDPEIPVNIYELGLIYGIDIDAENNVGIRMTLTSPACPVAGSLPGEVDCRVRTVPGVKSVNVELVWEPPWDMTMMSESARLQLNLF